MKSIIGMGILLIFVLAMYKPYLSNCVSGIDQCEPAHKQVKVIDHYFFTSFSTGIVKPHEILPSNTTLLIGQSKFLDHPSWTSQ